jgi:hypothetical protein
VRTDIEQNDLVGFEAEDQDYTLRIRQAHSMPVSMFPMQPMKPQPGGMRIRFELPQYVFEEAGQLGMAAQEFPGRPLKGLGPHQSDWRHCLVS